jgi:hypothetical protein
MADVDPRTIEALYEALAQAIDRVRADGAPARADERERLFLAKLSLAALCEIGDAGRGADLIALAAEDVDLSLPSISR